MSDTIWFNTDEEVVVSFNVNDEDGDGYSPNSKPVVTVFAVHGAGNTSQAYEASAFSVTGAPAGLYCAVITATANTRLSAGATGIVHVSASVSGGASPGAVVAYLKNASQGAAATNYKPASLSAIADTTQIAASVSAIATVVSAILTDTGTTLNTLLTDIQGATFDTATDSLEAIRNQGDSNWTGNPPSLSTGTAQTGSDTTITLQASATAVDDYYKGGLVRITAGKGFHQAPRVITGYAGSTRVASCYPAWVSAPDNTTQYEIQSDQVEVIAVPSTSDITKAVWDVSTVGHTSAGTFGQQAKSDIDAILSNSNLYLPLIGTAVTSATLFSAIAAIEALTSAETSAVVAAALSNYDVATSADVSAIGVNVLTNYGVPTSANMSAMMSAVGSAVAKNAADDYNALVAADLVGSEPTGVTSASSTLVQKIDMIHALAVNKITQTSTSFTLRTSADDGDIVTATVSDDGTTFTRGKLS